MWNDLRVLGTLADVFPRVAQRPASGAHRLRGLTAALAATVVLAVAIGFVLQRRPVPSPMQVARSAPLVQTFESPIGSTREVALEDGSGVTLNSGTQLSVAIGPKLRDLRLARGEAHFRVAHDVDAPFRVQVGGRVLQALGTQFSARLLADGTVDVLVTEGAVRIDADSGRPVAGSKRVTAGQAARVDGAGYTSVRDVAAVDVDILLAWQRGMLIFQGEPLDTVLQEFNRYTTDRFVVASPALGALRVGGYFRAGDTEALLIALRENFHIASSRDSHGRIVLTDAR